MGPSVPHDAAGPAHGTFRAVLLGCELVAPVGIGQELPDGGVVEAASLDPVALRVRLEVRVENHSANSVLVDVCKGSLRVIDVGARRPDCSPLQDTWTLVHAGGTHLVYPTLPAPPLAEGTFTEPLLPNLGHAPDDSWRTYALNSVTFALSGSECRPVEDGTASPRATPG